ncbi:TNF receptor-associated factor 6-A-like [Ixodes scapularis]|uniref:TNF receptor-associated factor 6-A-like n=1 Tax=Ixodes scapularis TaxID=6945 RepID=UPI001A9CC509|nr:TNF receptor-associated factor 6-A-like [Ixodes scapularis]
MAKKLPNTLETRMLSGFSNILDWRPLEFLHPIHGDLICDVCGLVSKSPVKLGCEHVYCSFCCNRGMDQKPPRCPLDTQKLVAGKPALSIPWAHQTVTNNRIRCPNAPHGCQYVAAPPTASKKAGTALKFLEEHYCECLHHRVTCGTCSGPVVLAEIMDHLRGDCGSTDTIPKTVVTSAPPSHLQDVE